MVIASKAGTIGVIIISLGLAFLLFYFFSDFSKEEKKKYTDELISQLVNFILFMWAAKILLNLPLFIQDPLAVLAYPSDSNAFYLAVLFTTMIIIYKKLRKNLNLLLFAEAFTYVFLLAVFFHEFLQFILNENAFSLGYLILFLILLLVLYFLQGRIKTRNLLLILLIGLTIGLLVLNIIYPYVALFGFLIEQWFIIVFFVASLACLFIFERND
ncbi:hypothetical protein [Oceanobacillus sp. CAU 1775]